MSDYRRNYDGCLFFFTVVTYQRRSFLVDDDDARGILNEAFRVVQAEYPFKILALCLLPDHLHCIWQLPMRDCDYSKRWQLIKRHFTRTYLASGGKEVSQSISRVSKGEKGIWQRRFWEHRIRDEQDKLNHLHYIHFNPVKHGYVDRPDDWPYSTYNRYKKSGLYGEFDWDVISEFDFENK